MDDSLFLQETTCVNRQECYNGIT